MCMCVCEVRELIAVPVRIKPPPHSLAGIFTDSYVELPLEAGGGGGELMSKEALAKLTCSWAAKTPLNQHQARSK